MLASPNGSKEKAGSKYKTVALYVYNESFKQAFQSPLSVRLNNLPTMRFQQVIGSLAAFTSFATAVDLTGYEYVVVGSGAGGGYVLQATWISSSHV
jgi:hypothetical protein